MSAKDIMIQGAVSSAGTYIHGIFDNSEFALHMVNNLRRKKGLDVLDVQRLDYQAFKQTEYDRPARQLRERPDLSGVYEIMNTWKQQSI